ncbi:MAG: hypothetical protein P1U38_13815 [Aeromicrobium sp.]|uniref:hypothetical protein n=1 Tax=Aeromicrobium sp. TaxID=1871063 RepID=UPI00261AFB02|nr:hypothetical protein [Aeromicrobium sp.]MDF1705842.1 hypothetical protein [Aeromicrobium sp.]
MTTAREVPEAEDGRMVWPFPKPPPRVRLAYRELSIAANGRPEEIAALGNVRNLPRPWLPATCADPVLRVDLWKWLDRVAAWINHEYVFDPAGIIPTCWPRHPHLIHELAVLADQRHRVHEALSSDLIEEWHRYTLPAFLERMRIRMQSHCERQHTPWPSRSRYVNHVSDAEVHKRTEAYAGDIRAARTEQVKTPDSNMRPGLRVVDLETGELMD